MTIKFITKINSKVMDLLCPLDKIYRTHQELKELDIKRYEAESKLVEYHNHYIAPLIREEEKLRNSLFTATTKEKEIIEAMIDELVKRKSSLTNSDEYKRKEKAYKKYKEKYYEYIREKLNDKEQDLILAQDIYKKPHKGIQRK